MSINIGPPKVDELRPRITVIGVGGAGGNAIANMINADIEGVDFIVANTDAQALNNSISEHRIQLGPDITQGLGAGSRPEVGRAAAEETLDEVERALEGAHMCFIAAGMGGGTGTGAAPVIAKAARDRGVLTVGVVTKPFLFEGTRRMRAADAGIEELQKHVDTLIVIPNQNLFLVAKAETTFKEAFSLADEVLQQGVRSITDLMVMPGLINLDFADVRSVMGEMGKAMMGTGEGSGENRALEAAERAISNPLLDGVSMQGAKGVIISIIGGEDMKLLEVDEAANHIRELVDPNANIIWGSAFNPDLQGKIRVSVVATGIEQSAEMAQEASRPYALPGTARGPAVPTSVVPQTLAAPEPAPATTSWNQAADTGLAAPTESSGHELPGAEGGFTGTPDAGDADSDQSAAHAGGAAAEDALDLELEIDEGRAEEDPVQDVKEPTSGYASLERLSSFGRKSVDDGLLGTADRLVEEDENLAPKVSRGISPLGKPDGGSGGGATLFERMANLSRGGRQAGPDAEEAEADEDTAESGGSLSIPRFLGRQNNQ
ncbi:cell division protein FtsZ [Novosphingobium sp. Gsoil 351]|uniref:cell division protein FtsZ n=1 Tax=Novosphingobium sp. Gsoil 351 TaxID=2675225 RepID=UPI0012B4F657|nr:cell division protein FtsZ [Novosphingobium sp. Gsoil 351]QGN55578.1 cell division protein FtsZ [Novosphingobium sp. Gsoil 351]